MRYFLHVPRTPSQTEDSAFSVTVPHFRKSVYHSLVNVSGSCNSKTQLHAYFEQLIFFVFLNLRPGLLKGFRFCHGMLFSKIKSSISMTLMYLDIIEVILIR